MTAFAAVAARAWSRAARLLGWRPAEFWDATPTELTGALSDPAAPGPGLDRTALAAIFGAQLEQDDPR